MTTPPNRNTSGSRRDSGSGDRSRARQERANRTTNRSQERNIHFHFGGGNDGGGARGPGGIGGSGGRHANRTHSPLADPEFFTNADIRNYCDTARQGFLQLSFELSMAAEVLQAVLKEVPDPDGRAFGSQLRARRVAKHLKKTAGDAKDAAKNAARTYAAFQREYSPEMAGAARRRPRQPRRRFDFGA